MIDGDSALLHLGDDRFLERLQSYLDVAPALRDRVHDMKSSFFQSEYSKGLREEWTLPPKRQRENLKLLPVLD